MLKLETVDRVDIPGDECPRFEHYSYCKANFAELLMYFRESDWIPIETVSMHVERVQKKYVGVLLKCSCLG